MDWTEIDKQIDQVVERFRTHPRPLDRSCGSCGHGLSVHDALGCRGIHVAGIPNSVDAVEVPCGCTKTVPVQETRQ